MAVTRGFPLFSIFQLLGWSPSFVWSGQRSTATGISVTYSQSWDYSSEQSWASKHPFPPGLASKSLKFKTNSSLTSLSDVSHLQDSYRGGSETGLSLIPSVYTSLAWCSCALLVNLLCDKLVLADVCRTCLCSVLEPCAMFSKGHSLSMNYFGRGPLAFRLSLLLFLPYLLAEPTPPDITSHHTISTPIPGCILQMLEATWMFLG